MADNEKAPALTPEQEAHQRIQDQIFTVMSDEITAMTQRYVAVYGLEWRMVVWALHTAQVRALQRLHPEIQLSQWSALVGVMEKKLKALSGEAPPAEEPAEDAADA